jgi:hypothetical protein
MAEHKDYVNVLFKQLDNDNKLKCLLLMHDSVPQKYKDEWLLHTSETSWRNNLAKEMISKASTDRYDNIASTFLENLSVDVSKKVTAFILVDNCADMPSSTEIPVSPPPSKKSRSGDASRGVCYSKIQTQIKASSKEDEENDSDYAEDDETELEGSCYKKFGTTPLFTKQTTEGEFGDGEASFIQLVHKDDNQLGYNLVYVLMSILQYASGKTIDFSNLNVETDVVKITIGTMVDQLKEHKVQFKEIKITYHNILTGIDYTGKLILLVFNVERHKNEEELVGKTIPQTWKHFCLFFQSNKVLLTFNQFNINYKFGKILKLKSTDDFQKYSDDELNKKIIPVARKEASNTEKASTYANKRKMAFEKAFVIEKN